MSQTGKKAPTEHLKMSFLPYAFLALTLVAIAQGQGLVRTVTNPVNCFDAEKAANGDTVYVHYTGTLKSDGKEFDSSLKGEPINFELGQGRVIDGWEQGLVGTCRGESIRLEIPPELGYGEKGAGNGVIPPNADLVFEMTLVDLKKQVKIDVTKEVSCTSDQKTRDKDSVTFNYIGKLANGTVFDSTYDSGRQPLEIEIGASGIKGWDQALTGACKGEKRTVFVPSELAYGEKGADNLVPPNASLILEIEVLNYKDRVIGFLERFSSGTFKG